jgi:hypothetical protein
MHRPWATRGRVAALRGCASDSKRAGIRVARPVPILDRELARVGGRWAEPEEFVRHVQPSPSQESYLRLFEEAASVCRCLMTDDHGRSVVRRGLAAASCAAAVWITAAGCSGGTSVSARPAPPQCAVESRPPVALVVRLTIQPSADHAACLGRTYLNIIAPDWDDLPQEVHSVDPQVRLWQTRSLQFGFEPCASCAQPALDLAAVRHDHPDWILKDASGADVHPPGHPDWVMYDISNVFYLQAWADAAEGQLGSAGWSGVVLVDAGNEPAWVNSPIDPNTHTEMTAKAHMQYLAEALAQVRAGLKTNGGFSVIAENGPPSVVDPHQIGSSDAVSIDDGFATLTGEAWVQLYTYYEAAIDDLVGAWVWERQPHLDFRQRVFGLASYLLVSGPNSAYGVAPDGHGALYRLDPGVPSNPPYRQGGAYLRSFDLGAVAVNPGPATAVVQLPGETESVTIPAGGAVIDVSGRLTTS